MAASLMTNAAMAALKLGPVARWLLRLAVRLALKRLNKMGAGYFTWELSREVRGTIVAEIMRLIEEAKRKTPNFTVDEQALQCAAWILESDRLQRTANRRSGRSVDVHALPPGKA